MPSRFGLGRQVVEDLDLERLAALLEEGAALGRRQLAADERMVGGDALRIRSSMAARSSGVSGRASAKS